MTTPPAPPPTEGRLEWTLGPKANPDGTPLDPNETRHRLASQRWLLKQLAARHKLEIREVGHHPPSERVSMSHANRIRQAAQSAMDTTAEETIGNRHSLPIDRHT